MDLDLCAIPSLESPNGVYNFSDPAENLAPLTIGLSSLLLSWSTIFVAGRLYANRRDLTAGDYFLALALAFNIVTHGLVFKNTDHFRHQWDVPVCWSLSHSFLLEEYVWDLTFTIVFLFARTSLFLLYLRLFSVSNRARWATYFGFLLAVANFVLSTSIISTLLVPSPGESWEDYFVEASTLKHVTYALHLSIAQSALNAFIDIYAFAIPLVMVLQVGSFTGKKLQKRLQIIAVFCGAILGLLASLLSLGYRVKALGATDLKWYSAMVTINILCEANMILVVTSAPGFARFTRQCMAHWPLIVSLRSSLGRYTGKPSSGLPGDESDLKHLKKHPNQPRTGRDNHPRQGPYKSLDNDTWLLNTGGVTVVDIEMDGVGLKTDRVDKSVRVDQTVDVYRASPEASSSKSRNSMVARDI